MPKHIAMLAHTIEDKRSSVVFPGYVQPKLDGVRCLLTPEGFYSRSNKAISGVPILEKITMERFGSLPLDGELYSKHMSFQEIVSCVRRSTCINEKMLVQYHVYDIACHNLDFTKRHLHLTGEFWRRMLHYDRLVLVPTYKVVKWDDINKRLEQFISEGYEGLMYRHPGATYQFGKRSKYLLKYKKMKTEDVICIGYKEGNGKHEGMLGALECIGEDSSIVWVGSGFDDEQRCIYWNKREECIDKTLTIKYQEKTDGGVSRFPVFVCWRDYE